jgi:ribonuclease HI
MSWRPDSPVELSDGSLVCQAHRLVVCGICTVDYSFMQTSSRGAEAEEPPQEEVSQGIRGLIGYLGPKVEITEDMFAACQKFIPPRSSDTPQDLFANGQRPLGVSANGQRLHGVASPRFVRTTNQNQILIYTDGACLNNGQIDPPPAAGCAFVFRPDEPDGTVKFRLEEEGPTGNTATQTSNRAELRAVIAALQYREWGGEGWHELVIATDSEYVAFGATEWVVGWLRNGWKTSQRFAVKNRDLWELLLTRVQQLARGQQLQVLFWRIPRNLNQRADAAAKNAATEPNTVKFVQISGILV